MPQGSYNVSRLISKLGLKNVVEMPVSRDIQLTMPIMTAPAQVPLHVGGVSVFGGLAAAVVAENSAFELQCLDPGGGVIQWIARPESQIVNWRISFTPFTFLTGPTVMVRQDFTNDPSVSILRSGSGAGPSATGIPGIIGQVPNSNYAPLYVPRGAFVLWWAGASNSLRRMTLGFAGITATEAEDS